MKLWSQYVSRKSSENQIKNYEHELTVLKSANKCRHGCNQRTVVHMWIGNTVIYIGLYSYVSILTCFYCKSS